LFRSNFAFAMAALLPVYTVPATRAGLGFPMRTLL
jgi:hypothetical protein